MTAAPNHTEFLLDVAPFEAREPLPRRSEVKPHLLDLLSGLLAPARANRDPFEVLDRLPDETLVDLGLSRTDVLGLTQTS